MKQVQQDEGAASAPGELVTPELKKLAQRVEAQALYHRVMLEELTKEVLRKFAGEIKYPRAVGSMALSAAWVHNAARNLIAAMGLKHASLES